MLCRPLVPEMPLAVGSRTVNSSGPPGDEMLPLLRGSLIGRRPLQSIELPRPRFVRVWGFWGDDVEQVRLQAYLRVRQMAVVLPFPFVESCMKGLYLSFAKRAKVAPTTAAAKMSMRVMEG